MFIGDDFWRMSRNSPGGHFRHTNKEHDQGRTTSPNVNALVPASIKSSLAFRLVSSALLSAESNPSPHGFISNHSLSRLYLPAKSKSSPSCYSSTRKALYLLSAYRSSTHHSPLWCLPEPSWQFFFFFFLATWLTGSYFPDQGLNLGPQQWKSRVLTTGLPGNSQGKINSTFF